MGFIVVIGALTITFFAQKSVGGDPVRALLGERGDITPELVEIVTKQWGLDKPLHIQYFTYLSNFLQGNLGMSMVTHHPVLQDLATRIPVTVELMIGGYLIALVLGILIGVLSGVRRGSIIDHASRIFAILGVSAPSFWWAVLFLFIFYRYLGIVGTGRLSYWINPPPTVTGMYVIDALIAGDTVAALDALKHLFLPSFTLSIIHMGITMRITRSSILEVLNSDYVRTARMKGLRERVVIMKHVLRNALIPTVTYVGPMFGGMLGGSVFIETVFSWNGMGKYAVDSLLSSDLQGLLGTVAIMATFYATANIIVDLLYGVLDPRVRVHG